MISKKATFLTISKHNFKKNFPIIEGLKKYSLLRKKQRLEIFNKLKEGRGVYQSSIKPHNFLLNNNDSGLASFMSKQAMDNFSKKSEKQAGLLLMQKSPSQKNLKASNSNPKGAENIPEGFDLSTRLQKFQKADHLDSRIPLDEQFTAPRIKKKSRSNKKMKRTMSAQAIQNQEPINPEEGEELIDRILFHAPSLSPSQSDRRNHKNQTLYFEKMIINQERINITTKSLKKETGLFQYNPNEVNGKSILNMNLSPRIKLKVSCSSPVPSESPARRRRRRHGEESESDDSYGHSIASPKSSFVLKKNITPANEKFQQNQSVPSSQAKIPAFASNKQNFYSADEGTPAKRRPHTASNTRTHHVENLLQSNGKSNNSATKTALMHRPISSKGERMKPPTLFFRQDPENVFDKLEALNVFPTPRKLTPEEAKAASPLSLANFAKNARELELSRRKYNHHNLIGSKNETYIKNNRSLHEYILKKLRDGKILREPNSITPSHSNEVSYINFSPSKRQSIQPSRLEFDSQLFVLNSNPNLALAEGGTPNLVNNDSSFVRIGGNFSSKPVDKPSPTSIQRARSSQGRNSNLVSNPHLSKQPNLFAKLLPVTPDQSVNYDPSAFVAKQMPIIHSLKNSEATSSRNALAQKSQEYRKLFKSRRRTKSTHEVVKVSAKVGSEMSLNLVAKHCKI